MQDYSERSSRYTDNRLLSILREADKYHPEAVAAAREEVERRGLQEEVLAFVAPEEKVSFLERIGGAPAEPKGREDILDWFGAPVTEEPYTLRFVYGLIGVLVLLAIANLYSNFDYLWFVLFDELSFPDPFVVFLSLTEPAIMLTAAFLVFRRKLAGYQIAAALTGFWIIGLLGMLIFMYQINAEEGYSVGELLTMDFPTFLNSLALPIAQVCIMAWLLWQPRVKSYFAVPTKSFQRYFLVGLVIGILLRVSLMFIY